jgi:hypothetical protein
VKDITSLAAESPEHLLWMGWEQLQGVDTKPISQNSSLCFRMRCYHYLYDNWHYQYYFMLPIIDSSEYHGINLLLCGINNDKIASKTMATDFAAVLCCLCKFLSVTILILLFCDSCHNLLVNLIHQSETRIWDRIDLTTFRKILYRTL